MIVKILLILAGTLSSLAASGATYEAVASAHDAERYPPPGRLVDVGGYAIHLFCSGESERGAPTILLDAWSGGWSTEWLLVQPTLAQNARVCAWDRAGSGWSDLGPHDHSPRAYADEMSALLDAAHIDGPYVLVAASYGGRVARLFTARHPDQVVGLVFVDAVHEDAYSPADLDRHRELQARLALGNFVLGRLGVGRLLGPDLTPFIDGPSAYQVPESTRELISVIALRPKNVEGNARLAAHQAASDAELRSTESLGNRPVVVLTSSTEASRSASWAAAQTKLAALSTHSSHTVVDSHHLIAWEHPDVVIDAVGSVLRSYASET